MRIAQVAPLYESVPPTRYGGTERVVSYLTEELVRRGHEVTLFASGDSVTGARLVAAVPRALRLSGDAKDPYALHLAALLDVYDHADDFDVIHLHTDYVGLPLTRGVPTPTVLTLHGRLDISDVHPVYRAFPHVAFCSISTAQRAPVPDVSWAATVHHGLPRDLYRFGPGGGYLLFVGRISPEKKPDAAIRIARAAGLPLVIAAKVDPADRAYWETVVQPLVAQPGVRFVGEVGESGKEELLRGARALLFPVDWPEPFGLVLIEALACGTPVIARCRGSVPEIVDEGETGFVCETDDEMVEAAGRLGRIDRHACRRTFERRFSVEHMVDAYEAVYERACGAGEEPAELPRFASGD